MNRPFTTFATYSSLALSCLSTFTLVGTAHADEALAKAKGCTACHQVDKKVIGPAYAQVAACYSKNAAAIKPTLVKHVKEGASGNWGAIPMPAHPQVSNDDVAKIVDWVLSRKPSECPKEFKGAK